MKFPFEYPFSTITNLSETIQKENILNKYFESGKKNIILEYLRTEKRNTLGATVVNFNFWVTSVKQNGKNEKILVLSNRIVDREHLYDFIEYLETLAKKHNIELINKFYNDGYSYDRKRIKRIIQPLINRTKLKSN